MKVENLLEFQDVYVVVGQCRSWKHLEVIKTNPSSKTFKKSFLSTDFPLRLMKTAEERF